MNERFRCRLETTRSHRVHLEEMSPSPLVKRLKSSLVDHQPDRAAAISNRSRAERESSGSRRRCKEPEECRRESPRKKSSSPARVSPTLENAGLSAAGFESTPESTPRPAELLAACLRQHLTDEQVGELLTMLMETKR